MTSDDFVKFAQGGKSNPVTPKSEKSFALGVKANLDDFAKKHGAETYKSPAYDPNKWKNTVMEKIYDPDTKVLMNLDIPGGKTISPWESISRAAVGKGYATD